MSYRLPPMMIGIFLSALLPLQLECMEAEKTDPITPSQDSLQEPSTLRSISEDLIEYAFQPFTVLKAGKGIIKASWSFDGRFLLTGAAKGKVKVWDALTGKHVHTLKGPTDDILSVAFNSDDTLILSCSKDKTAHLWDTQTGEDLVLNPKNYQLVSATFSPDGSILFVGGDDKKIRLFNTFASQLLRTLNIYSDSSNSITCNPDGQSILTNTYDTIYLWDILTGKELLKIRPGEDIRTCGFSPDGKTIFTATKDGTLRLWDSKTRKHLHVLEGHQGAILTAAWSRDGNTILTGSLDRTARLWDAHTGKLLTLLEEHAKSVCTVGYSPDGRTLFTASTDNRILLWKRPFLSLEQFLDCNFQPFKKIKVCKGFIKAKLSFDGKTVLAGGAKGALALWDATTGEQLKEFKGHTDAINSVSFSSDSTLILSSSNDTTARVWNAATGEQLKELKHNSPVLSAEFSPDGKTILTGEQEKKACLWNSATGELIKECKEDKGPVFSVAFSPTGTTISGTYGAARVWGKLGLHHSGQILAVAFSPNGKTILTASGNETARLWDAKSGNKLFTLKGHTARIVSASFSPDGKTILTGSWDTTARLWDASTGKQLIRLKEHPYSLSCVAFSGDGATLLTASDDKTVILWKKAEIVAACSASETHQTGSTTSSQ